MLTFLFKASLYFVWRLIPESPRWLIAKDRLDEAHELLMKYAKRNRVIIESIQLKHAIQEFKKEQVRNRNENRKTYGILDMVRTPKLRKRTIICGFNWWVEVLWLIQQIAARQNGEPLIQKSRARFWNDASSMMRFRAKWNASEVWINVSRWPWAKHPSFVSELQVL